MVFVGTVIGAGFASGAEIYTYFTRYGRLGFVGMGLAAGIFVLAAWGFLRMTWERGLTNFAQAAQLLMGEKAGTALDTVVTAFMFIGLGVMLAGTGAVFEQQWGIDPRVGAGLMAVLCFASLCGGGRGVVAVNAVLGPVLIGGMLLLAFTAANEAWRETARLAQEPLSLLQTARPSRLVPALLSALIYASYNMLSAGAVFAGLGDRLQSAGQARRTAFLGGAVLAILIFAVGLATFLNYDTIETVPVPALAILRNYPVRQNLYILVLVGAMLTTAVSDGFGVLRRLEGVGGFPRWLWSLIISVGALAVSGFGFGRLVEQGYLIFGCIGLGQLAALFYYCIKRTGGAGRR